MIMKWVTYQKGWQGRRCVWVCFTGYSAVRGAIHPIRREEAHSALWRELGWSRGHQREAAELWRLWNLCLQKISRCSFFVIHLPVLTCFPPLLLLLCRKNPHILLNPRRFGDASLQQGQRQIGYLWERREKKPGATYWEAKISLQHQSVMMETEDGLYWWWIHKKVWIYLEFLDKEQIRGGTNIFAKIDMENWTILPVTGSTCFLSSATHFGKLTSPVL